MVSFSNAGGIPQQRRDGGLGTGSPAWCREKTCFGHGKMGKTLDLRKFFGNLYEFMRISLNLCFFFDLMMFFNGDFIQIQWDLKDVQLEVYAVLWYFDEI